MTAPFRDSTEAQIAALKDRVEALDLEVKTLKQKPTRTYEPKPMSVSALVYRVLAANVALAWLLIGSCAHFDAPAWVIAASGITGLAFLGASIGTLIVRAS